MITITRAVQTCGACPSQWDAWDVDGDYYYLRYRSGCGSVTRFANEHFWQDPAQRGEPVTSFTFGGWLDGCISLEKFAELAGITLAGEAAGQ